MNVPNPVPTMPPRNGGPPPFADASTQPADPTTPGSRPRPSALGSAATTAATGAPAAVVAVWLLQTYGTAHGKPLVIDALTATAIGGVGGAIGGYLWQVFQGFMSALLEKVGAA